MTEILIAAGFVFGTCIGSFLNVLIWRLPRDEKITGRSHCPNCRHTLEWWNLIPLLSFLFQRQQCQYCKTKISPRYFWIEFLTGILFALVVWFVAPIDWYTALLAVKFAFIIAVLIIVFIIDYEHYLILDKVVLPAAGIIVVLNLILDLTLGTVTYSLDALLSGVLAFLPFWLIWKYSKGQWMGFGDAKLALFMGVALGFPGIVVALFLSFMGGAIIGLSLIGIGAKKFGSRLPFGTFLSLATLLTVFYGQKLWDFYWSWFM